jgi:hypothetical protein
MSNAARMKAQMRNKRTVANGGDTDYAGSASSAARKTSPFVSDIALILSAIAQDSKFAASDATRVGKTPVPVLNEHLARQVVFNHLTPAHHYMAAEIIYKNARGGRDLSRVKALIQSDERAAELREGVTEGGKSARQRMVNSARVTNNATDSEYGTQTATANYKSIVAQNGDRRIRLYSADQTPSESDRTLFGATPHVGYRVANPEDQEATTGFLDNAVKERLGGRMGSKYTQRYVDADARAGAIAAEN